LSGRASDDFIETVRAAGDLVRVVSDYVALKPAGARLKGLCPFHQEKTPSFSVDPSAQLFYCFGCQTGGDLFKFVMLYEKVGFREAAEMLAHRFGVPVPASRPRDDRRERLLDAIRSAEAFFRERLRDPDAGRRGREYVERRGLDPEVVERLGIGYAPDSWDALRNHLQGRRFRIEELAEAGLVLARRDGSGHYDRFRDRLIFPIRDVSGRTLAFGGRTLGDAEPKYVNSPETPAYTKGSHLYGLDLAREEIRRQGFAIVVEGYLDLAAVVQAGIGNAVASLGTALTAAQAQLLARCTEHVVVSYDGDSAGAAAAVRSLDLLLGRGFRVRVVELPDKADPDDFIRERGAGAFGALVAGAPSYLEFLIDRETRGRDLDRPEERVAAANAVLPHVARLASAVERASWAGRLADSLRLEDEVVLQELGTALKTGRPRVRHRPRGVQGPSEVESRLVTLLLRFDDGRAKAVQGLEPGDLDGSRVGSIVRTILDLEAGGRDVDYQAVFSALERDEDRDLLARIALRDEPDGEPSETDDCIRSLRRRRLMRERRELQRRIGAAADAATVDSLLRRTQELARQIDGLS
jgi:DNA primase